MNFRYYHVIRNSPYPPLFSIPFSRKYISYRHLREKKDKKKEREKGQERIIKYDQQTPIEQISDYRFKQFSFRMYSSCPFSLSLLRCRTPPYRRHIIFRSNKRNIIEYINAALLLNLNIYLIIYQSHTFL